MFKKLFGWLIKFLKKIWAKLRKFLAILLVILAVVFLVWGLLIYVGALAATSVVVGGVTVGITTASAVAIGAVALSGAFLVDDDAAQSAVDKVGGAVGDAAGAVGGVVGDAVGGLAGGLFSSPWVWLVGGGLLLWSLGGNDE